MCQSMVENFDEYWSEYSIVLAFEAIFYPRIKLQMLEYFYSMVDNDSTKCQEKVSIVKEKLYQLFEACANTSKSGPSESQFVSSLPTQCTRKNMGKKRLYEGIKAFGSRNFTKTGKSELDLYLEEPKFDFFHFEELDILEYWKNQKNHFPNLALMACDVLAIPITIVASESTFSIGARVLTKYRSCIIPENFQALICTCNRLHGFEPSDRDGVGVKTSISSSGSDLLETIEEEENQEDHDDKMVDEF